MRAQVKVLLVTVTRRDGNIVYFLACI